MNDITQTVLALLAGLLVGAFLAWRLLRWRAGAESAATLAGWRSEELPGIRRRSLESSRTGIKARLGVVQILI